MTMQLPAFEFHRPTTLEDALLVLADLGTSAKIVAGGTDLLPKMKRNQVLPTGLVSLTGISEMTGIRLTDDGRCIIGASTTLREMETSSLVPPVMADAAALVASPQIRNVATVGGNLCLDTRCNFVDMSESWRNASGHCLKDGGDVCRVAPRGERCWAVSSSDLAPVAIALEASVRLVSARGDRLVAVEDLYRNDGLAHLAIAPDEILVELVVPPRPGRATYHKLRRRGAIDFAILGVAAAATFDDAGICVTARIVLGAVASAPLRATEAETSLVGRRLTPEVIEDAARLASQPVRLMDNTDMGPRYRKWMASVFVARALGDLVTEPASPRVGRGDRRYDRPG